MEGRIDRKYYTGYLSGVADGLNQGRQDTIVELEQIKAKIKNDCILHEEWFVNIDDLEKCLLRIDTIFYKEISELKGETE